MRAFEETSNMLSREAILSNLVFVDKNLTHREKDNTSEKGFNPFPKKLGLGQMSIQSHFIQSCT